MARIEFFPAYIVQIVIEPGNTTAPFGRRAMTERSSAVAGIEPVEPAAITIPCGGVDVSWCANLRRATLRRAAGLLAPSLSRTCGQA